MHLFTCYSSSKEIYIQLNLKTKLVVFIFLIHCLFSVVCRASFLTLLLSGGDREHFEWQCSPFSSCPRPSSGTVFHTCWSDSWMTGEARDQGHHLPQHHQSYEFKINLTIPVMITLKEMKQMLKKMLKLARIFIVWTLSWILSVL